MNNRGCKQEMPTGMNMEFPRGPVLGSAWEQRRHVLAATLLISQTLNTSSIAADQLLNFGQFLAFAPAAAYWQHCVDQEEIKSQISDSRGLLDLHLDATSNGFAETKAHIQCLQEDLQTLKGLVEKNAKNVQSVKEDAQSLKEMQENERQLQAKERQLQAKERQLSKDRYAYMMQQLGFAVPAELLE